MIDERDYVRDVVRNEPNMRLWVVNNPGLFQSCRGGIDSYTLMPSASCEPEHGVLARAKREGIEILLEMPHDRRIAEAYSRGALASEVVPEYVDAFLGLYRGIEKRRPGAERVSRSVPG